MSKNSKFRSKTHSERIQYQNSIKSASLDSTIETGNFQKSDYDEEETSYARSVKKRPTSFFYEIGEYIKKNWVGLLFAIIIFIIGFLTRDALVRLAVIDTKLESQQSNFNQFNEKINIGTENIQTNIEKIELNIEELESENNSQNLLITEIKLRLGFLEKLIEEKR